jgi:hypothetical protein
MPLPPPTPGLVIHYEYLWRHESEQGEERGLKRRPCAIVVAVAAASGEIETVVAPITHSEPIRPSEGVEIPPRVKASLRLDSQRSWVIVTDLNAFIWPGIDVYPVPNTPLGTYEYGYLPPRLFEVIRNRISALSSMKMATRRTE